MNINLDEIIEKLKVSEFEKVGDEGLFPNHSDKDIWEKGFEMGSKAYIKAILPALLEEIVNESLTLYKENGYTNTGMRVKKNILNQYSSILKQLNIEG